MQSAIESQMTTKNRIILLIAAVFLAILAAYIHFNRVNTSATKARTSTPISLARKSSTQNVAQKSTPSLQHSISNHSATVKHNILPAKEMEESRDYRVLFERLIRNPTDSSGLYAANILLFCAATQQLEFKEIAKTNQQIDAQHLMKDRCATFTSDEVSIRRLKELDSDPRLRGEYQDLYKSWRNSKTATERNDFAKSIFAKLDPLLLEMIGPTLISSATSGIIFEGRRYAEPYAQPVFQLAWSSAVCDTTELACGLGDKYVVDACANHGNCVSTRGELMQKLAEMQFGKPGIDLYNTIQPDLVKTIRDGNVDAFSPSR